MASWLRAVCLLVVLVVPGLAFADPAPFDLAGPKLKVSVTRDGKMLPISAVPNLLAGDQLSIRADLPPGQSAHYLLVAAFLRGATNPPPENWFYASETWSPRGRDGLKITVPENAQQVLVFLAPETGGDFKTLINAVRGRPGAFVRASQDLNQATLDRSRLKVYLAAIHRLNQAGADQLKTASPLLARSLSIKFNPDCLQKIPELQAPCLMQGQDTLVLDDGHSASIVEALTSGSSADLAFQVSGTAQANFGYYSPYIASVMDIARIMDSFHTAQYQYIPALATEQDDQLSLELNTPPSFHNPKSVLVVALPAVESPQMPPLQPVDPKEVYCAEKTELVLPVGGAPLVFSTGYAHDMVLRLKGKDGKSVDLPVKADPGKGGFIANTAGLSPTNFGDALDGSLHGFWGFEPYNGPEFQLRNARPQQWQLSADDQQALVVGRDGIIHLEAQDAACVDSVMLQQASGKAEKADWKSAQPNEVVVTVPLKNVHPGALKLLIKQYGSKEIDTVPLQAFAQAGHLESFTLHAGDLSGVLKGSRLDEVTGMTLGAVHFKPGPLSASGGTDELSLVTTDSAAVDSLKPGDSATAKVTLKDGRTLTLETSVEGPRPKVTLIGKSIQPSPSSVSSNIQLADQDELPQNALLTFSIHAEIPAAFSGDEKIEVATVRGAYLTTLTMTNGMTLEDSQVAVATLDTGKVFGSSASGPLRFRILDKGVAGDWQPLATLVRLPVLRNLKCPALASDPCKLTGSNLFLVDSVSGDSQFDHPVQVSQGFPGFVLSVPHPTNGQLYVKLHDDPAVVNPVALPAEELAPAPTPAPDAKSPGATAPIAAPGPGAAPNPASPKTDGSSPAVPPTAPPPAAGKTPPPSVPSAAPPVTAPSAPAPSPNSPPPASPKSQN